LVVPEVDRRHRRRSHLGVPLVTKDRAITATGVVETIW